MSENKPTIFNSDVKVNNLPRWKSHKVVRAGKISNIHFVSYRDEKVARLSVEVPGKEPSCVVVQHTVFEKHKPELGWYVVVYEDDYISFSPAEAFEAGYKLFNENEIEDVRTLNIEFVDNPRYISPLEMVKSYRLNAIWSFLANTEFIDINGSYASREHLQKYLKEGRNVIVRTALGSWILADGQYAFFSGLFSDENTTSPDYQRFYDVIHISKIDQYMFSKNDCPIGEGVMIFGDGLKLIGAIRKSGVDPITKREVWIQSAK